MAKEGGLIIWQGYGLQMYVHFYQERLLKRLYIFLLLLLAIAKYAAK